MSQPVKLSADLVLDARLTGQTVRRSIAGQIEYWANLGRALDPLLQGALAFKLARTGAARPLSACLAAVDTATGRKRLARHLESQPFPHYKPAGERPGLLVRVEADGTETLGRFVNREFQAVRSAKPK